MVESVIKEDYERGREVVQRGLDLMVNRYEAPNMFNDSRRQKYQPVHYRAGYTENINKILNNNTSLRVFDRNNPASPTVKPLLD